MVGGVRGMKTSKQKREAYNAVTEYGRLIAEYNHPDVTDEERGAIEKELFGIVDEVGEMADTFADEVERLRRLAAANDMELVRLSELKKSRLEKAERLETWLGKI